MFNFATYDSESRLNKSLRSPRTAILASTTWISFALIIVIALSARRQDGQKGFISVGFGPSPSLEFFTVPIDSWFRWLMLMLFVIIETIVENWLNQIGQSWVTNKVYDPNVHVLTYSHSETMILTVLSQLLWYIIQLIPVFLALTQIDLLCMRLLTVGGVTAFTTSLVIRPKSKPFDESAFEPSSLSLSSEGFQYPMAKGHSPPSPADQDEDLDPHKIFSVHRPGVHSSD